MRSGEFISMMELFFRKHDELVLGRETADTALPDSSAIDNVLSGHHEGSVAVVSHGTVIALFVARLSNQGAFELWRQMQLPSFAVLTAPGDEGERDRCAGLVHRPVADQFDEHAHCPPPAQSR